MPKNTLWNPCIVLVLVGVAALCGLTTGCTSLDPAPFEQRDIQRFETEHADENPERPLPQLHTKPEPTILPSTREARTSTSPGYVTPTTLPVPATPPNTPVVRLTLQQCIHLAAANSLTVRVAGYQPGIDEARVREAMAKWDPIFFEQLQFQHTDVVQPSISNPTAADPLGAPIRFSTLTSTTGIKQDTEYGAEIQLSYTAGYTDRVIPAALEQPGIVNPFYNDELTLKITQPLLQNFGREANYARIKIARNTQVSSLLDFRLALEKQMSDIEEAYWQLVEAERDVAIRENLLDRAKSTETLVRNRLGADATDLDVNQAISAVAEREEDIPTARATVEKLSNKLKRLINDPTMPVAGGPLLLPADEPNEQPIQFDPQDCINTALNYRAELAQQQTKIDTAYVTQAAAKNNELPTLNAVVSFGVEGDGQTPGQMFRSTGNANLLDYSVGVELDIPLGNQEAKAIFARTFLTRLQAIDQYRDLQEQVTQEVKDALADVNATWHEIDLSRQGRLKKQTELQALEDRIQNKGLVLSPPVTQQRLQTQSELADAERKEIEAITSFNIAVSQLERAKGTILRYNNVTMEEEVPGSMYPGHHHRDNSP